MDKTAKATKRSNQDEGPRKVPRAGDIIVDDVLPKAQTRNEIAPVIVCIYKYTSHAGDVYVDRYRENRTSLYQIQFDQDCRNNIFFLFKKKFESFLQTTDGVLPTTLMELSQQAGIDFKISPGDNSKGGLHVPWRVGAYVVGDIDAVKNALLLCDGYFQKEIKAVTGEPVYVHIHPHTNLDVAGIKDELDYKYYEFHEPSPKLPLKIFQCAPLKGGVITLNIQVQTEDKMSLVISGSGTYAYKTQFSQIGIGGGYQKPDSEDKGPYLRTMKDIDVTKAEDKEKVFKLLGNGCLNDLAVRVLVESDVDEDSDVGKFITDLKGMPNLHFE